jgi:hypothetical protein
VNKRKDKGVLACGLVSLFLGCGILWKGGASRFGAGQITGSYAKFVAVICLIFAFAVLLSYFRGPTEK